MHVHILGIAGTLMSSIAQLAIQLGYVVTGCDQKFYPPASERLEQLGISVCSDFHPRQLDSVQADLYIIGNVMKRGMPIIEEILNRSLPYCSSSQWLSEHVLRHRHVLAVAGTHGKTTTTAMLIWILQQAGYCPGFLIGGVPQFGDASADKGSSPFFVIEADEYDTAFFDKRSKFVHYHPRTLLINNIEYDHADIFSDLGDMLRQYHFLMRVLPGSGRLVHLAGSPVISSLIDQGCWTKDRVSFGQDSGADWQWRREGSDLVFYPRDHSSEWIVSSVVGSHNCYNALAAFLMASSVGVEPAEAVRFLSSFPGVKRRLECFAEKKGVRFFDDFAHHPTAIRTTIAGLRELCGEGRLFVLLEPASNSFKKGVWASSLAESLIEADSVFCYRSGVSWDLEGALSTLKSVCVFDDVLPLLSRLFSEIRPGDHVLIMSNSSFSGIYQKIREYR